MYTKKSEVSLWLTKSTLYVHKHQIDNLPPTFEVSHKAECSGHFSKLNISFSSVLIYVWLYFKYSAARWSTKLLLTTNGNMELDLCKNKYHKL